MNVRIVDTVYACYLKNTNIIIITSLNVSIDNEGEGDFKLDG